MKTRVAILVARINTSRVRYEPMPRSAREQLLQFFEPYNRRLERHLRVPLPPSWSR